ncbi:hypothetical protein C9I28_14010 [Pseudoduganella armeniaca]|uniref:Uncharacterized protein n=2 Tax=Pseudoduganella armeniaca TaxID=2072590 RepID=A0A2R4CHR4_9BURK|nr:hypothetical protein C9I28_14010 [Pseudoduganella armeniaca]
MQALKKAERARQNGLPEEEPAGTADWGLAPLNDTPAPAEAEAEAGAMAPAAAPAAAPGGLELSLEPLSLEPLDPAPRVEAQASAASAPPAPASAAASRPAPARPEPRIPLEPAAEAVHDPVPPQARHEPARPRPAATPPAAPRADAKGAEAAPRPDAAAVRAAARARAAAGAAKPGMDMARVRVAGLSGILLVLLGTFGYVYWRASTAPGPGAALPMVPMPPPSATGATGIVVAPAEPAGGLPPATPADATLATLPAQDSAGTSALPPAVAPASAAVATPLAAPATAQAPAPIPAVAPARMEARAPVLSGPGMSDDPDIMQAAQQDLAERQERAMRDQAADNAQGGATSAAPVAPAAPLAPAYVAGAASGGARPAASGDVRIARGSAPAIAPAVQSAYAAFQAGDLAGARQQYEAALRQDPNNRDALLGAAAVAQRENRGAQAAAWYARLLELDPQDPDALAALVALRPGDMARSEAKLREILKSRPDAGPVLFALGNLYARQARWPEAQQAYFRAFTAAPGNPDYAFNLAVGLDRLNQGKLAAGYYERALALPGQAGFDRAAVQRRLHELAAGSAPAAAPVLPPAPAPRGD